MYIRVFLGSLEVQWGSPNDVTLSKDQKTVFVADYNHNNIYKIDLLTEEVTLVCGTSTPGFSDGWFMFGWSLTTQVMLQLPNSIPRLEFVCFMITT